MVGIDGIQLANNAGATLTNAQNGLIGSATGTNSVTISDPGSVTANSAVESYTLANGTNTFNSSSSGHTVIGGTGAETFVGSSGVDLFDGGAGTDKFTGSGGADTFKFEWQQRFKYIPDGRSNYRLYHGNGLNRSRGRCARQSDKSECNG